MLLSGSTAINLGYLLQAALLSLVSWVELTSKNWLSVAKACVSKDNARRHWHWKNVESIYSSYGKQSYPKRFVGY